jgi:hypothetical protein
MCRLKCTCQTPTAADAVADSCTSFSCILLVLGLDAHSRTMQRYSQSDASASLMHVAIEAARMQTCTADYAWPTWRATCSHRSADALSCVHVAFISLLRHHRALYICMLPS